MTSVVTQETFVAALQSVMREKIEAALSAEIEVACERLRAELRGQVAQIALSMMSYYETYQRGDRLIIEIKNASGKP